MREAVLSESERVSGTGRGLSMGLRPGSIAAGSWIAFVALIGCYAPLLASGHPISLTTSTGTTHPLLVSLTPVDWLLVALPPAFAMWWLSRRRLGPAAHRWISVAVAIGAIACVVITLRTPRALSRFDYESLAQPGTQLQRTLVPWSPSERLNDRDVRSMRPGCTTDVARAGAVDGAGQRETRQFVLGSDTMGQDVLSNLIHGCRIALTVGLVSTGIALIIGTIIGALMGAIGGWIDLLLGRVIEVFQGVPVLFLLVLAAGVLPRSTPMMMAIIGCFTWTSAARFTRAEFLKLRGLDFVAAAKASGLPRWSVVFRHMLPNGITPVLVEAGFMVAGAILAEATLSFLGLGPDDQASWGRTLSMASGDGGDFHWWLAVFPGLAIFLTVLSYNVLGETIRERLDPKGRH